MPKAAELYAVAAPKFQKNNDTALLEMIERHDFLWKTWPPEGASKAHLDEACELEVKIIASPAFTARGLAGKRSVVRRAEIDDDYGIIAAILENDAECVGVGKGDTVLIGTHVN